MAPETTLSTAGLEEVGLGEIGQGLAGMVTLASLNLSENLVIEILGERLVSPVLVGVSGGGDKLLELDAGDKVLVLWGHDAVVPRHEENFMVSLRPSCLLLQVGDFLLLAELGQL